MNLSSTIIWPKCLGKVGWLDFLVGFFPPPPGSFLDLFFRRAAFQSGCLSEEKSLGRVACWGQQGWSRAQGGGGAGGGGGGEGGGGGRRKWRGGRVKQQSLGRGGAGAQPSPLHPSSSFPPSPPFPFEHKLCPRRGR